MFQKKAYDVSCDGGNDATVMEVGVAGADANDIDIDDDDDDLWMCYICFCVFFLLLYRG